MRVSWAEFSNAMQDCRRCRLCEGRNHIVPGEGNPNADLMFIGEGPGQEEDRLGRPFVGRSGELLTRMIHAIGVERADTYICNIVKCRPPQNRTPEADEAAACKEFLRMQFALVRPKAIVLLGKTACRYTIGEDIYITRDHGRWFERKGTWFIPTFHPSALLRDPTKKRDAWDDFQKIREKLKEISESEGDKSNGEVSQ